MKTHFTISKILQVLLLLSFVLPFFPPGCDTKKADTDSVKNNVYTSKDSSAVISQTIPPTDNLSKSYDNTKPKITERLAKKSTFLKLILRPKGNFAG